ncbi:MAG: glycine hydroxymethyltransferase [Simkaniaceae bacterium]|nr:glycine hydroxymethyltransferase [Simkaniaceae bacterium]
MDLLEKYFNETSSEERSKAAIAYLAALDHVGEKNPEIAKAILKELQDQRSKLKMIASENYSSYATQLAMGNLMTDKYSEGFPFHRFYAGCENVDTIEQQAVEELKKLFNCDHAYVQPHSGADANLVAFWAILTHRVQSPMLGERTLDALSPAEYEELRQALVNQKMLGMSLNAGGHLTHGYRHNVSAKMMQAFAYDVNPETMLLDYDEIERQVKKERPLILIAGYSAYPRKINFARMRQIADSVDATFMVDMAHFSGLVAGGVFTGEENPIPYAHIVTSTTHKTLRGPRGGMILCCDEYKDVVDKGCPLILGGPLPHVMAAKAVAFREAAQPEFKEYAHQIVRNSQALAESLMRKGVELFTGGTDNHLLVIDVAKSFGLNGRQAENALNSMCITVNRNTIPFDKNGPWYTSGVRIGTAALTSRGMKEPQMEEIGEMIYEVLSNVSAAKTASGKVSKAKVTIDESVASKVTGQVASLLKEFELYPEIVLEPSTVCVN